MLGMEEARNFYIMYNGHEYHMWHDETEMYAEYKKLDIQDSTKQLWRQEILYKLQQMIYALKNKNDCWNYIGEFVDVLAETDMEQEDNGKRLIDILKYATKNLDQKQKILIMEHMAGRNSTLTGGIYWICKNTKLEDEMFQILNQLTDFDVTFSTEEDGWTEPSRRYSHALRKMEEAAQRYSH